jgi:hypothetical protein
MEVMVLLEALPLLMAMAADLAALEMAVMVVEAVADSPAAVLALVTVTVAVVQVAVAQMALFVLFGPAQLVNSHQRIQGIYK